MRPGTLFMVSCICISLVLSHVQDVQAKLKPVCYGTEWHKGTCSNPNKCIAESNITDTRTNRYGVKPFRCHCENKNTTGITTRPFNTTTRMMKQNKWKVCQCEYPCR
ncbi:Plant self-incompatibility response protein [Raphanus sativus]|nr:Plant self-incompatibility response protein [Raphanus sativus]